jgi:hypothetical protein
MKHYTEVYPSRVGFRRNAAARSVTRPGPRPDPDRTAQAVHEAEIAARDATGRLLGPAVAARSTWEGRTDGTATGLIDGLAFTWAPAAPDGPGHLTLARLCWMCGARWATPVLSEGQLIGALVEDRCGCTRRTHPRAVA